MFEKDTDVVVPSNLGGVLGIAFSTLLGAAADQLRKDTEAKEEALMSMLEECLRSYFKASKTARSGLGQLGQRIALELKKHRLDYEGSAPMIIARGLAAIPHQAADEAVEFVLGVTRSPRLIERSFKTLWELLTVDLDTRERRLDCPVPRKFEFEELKKLYGYLRFDFYRTVHQELAVQLELPNAGVFDTRVRERQLRSGVLRAISDALGKASWSKNLFELLEDELLSSYLKARVFHYMKQHRLDRSELATFLLEGTPEHYAEDLWAYLRLLILGNEYSLT